VARENALSYSVSTNGPAGNWYWQVVSHRNVIARGLAPTRVQARAEAMKAVASYVERGQPSAPFGSLGFTKLS
jgi:hypothetical protein